MKTMLNRIIFPGLIFTTLIIMTNTSKASVPASNGILNKDLSSTLVLNGVSEYHSVPCSKDLITCDAITLETWFKSDRKKKKNEVQGLIERSSAGSYTYRLFLKNDNTLVFMVNTGKDYFVEAPVKAPYKWNHVAAAYNSKSGTLTIYLNGKTAATVTYKPAELLDFGSDSLFIGKYGNGYFKGQIDETRIWSKTERTGEDIIRYMARGEEHNLNSNDVVIFTFDNDTADNNTANVYDPAIEMRKDERISKYFTMQAEPRQYLNKNEHKQNLTQLK